MDAPFQLVLLPGLGADYRQFEPQESAFPNLVVPPWIPAEKGETLAQYASRMAGTIPQSPPLILGGSSFGGMVAYEMAKHLPCGAVVLIGSCREPKAIRPILRGLRSIVCVMPVLAVDLAKCLAPVALAGPSRLSRRQSSLCVAMFRDADSRFTKWACTAILNWQTDSAEGVRVFHIHGQNDLVIPAKRVDPDEIVPGGGHLINLTHPEQVSEFIRRALLEVL